jgi:apolipoprotein N-acyltransferase
LAKPPNKKTNTTKQDAGMALNAITTGAEKILALKGWARRGTAFAAGAATALSMAPFYALPLMAVGFTVLVLLIDAAEQAPRPKRSAFAMGWFFGFGYFLVGIYWFAFSFFVQADQFAWMAPFAVTGLPAFLAIFPALACLGAFMIAKPGWERVLAFAAIWTIIEYLRGHIMTGLPWNLAGQALAGTAMGAQTAAWYGAYGLSLIAVLIAASPAAGFGPRAGKVKPLWGFAVLLAGTALLYAAGAVRMALPEPQPDGENFLRVVQPNIPQREKIHRDYWVKNFERQLDLSKGPAPKNGRLFIIWPENGAPLINEASTALRVLGEELPSNAVLIVGAVRRERNDVDDELYYNSMFVIPQTPAGRRPVAAYDKHHLVPFGEYLPFFDLLNAIGLAQLTPYGDAGFSSGKGPTVLNAGGPSFAPLICYEAIFPGAIYPKGERPEWLLTVTNDAWFGDTSGPRQHLDMARLRSIESGLPMARSANTGISAVIDGKGRILGRIKLYQAGRLETPLPPALTPTLYDRYGDWFFWGLTLVFLLAGSGLPGRLLQRTRVLQ